MYDTVHRALINSDTHICTHMLIVYVPWHSSSWFMVLSKRCTLDMSWPGRFCSERSKSKIHYCISDCTYVRCWQCTVLWKLSVLCRSSPSYAMLWWLYVIPFVTPLQGIHRKLANNSTPSQSPSSVTEVNPWSEKEPGHCSQSRESKCCLKYSPDSTQKEPTLPIR